MKRAHALILPTLVVSIALAGCSQVPTVDDHMPVPTPSSVPMPTETNRAHETGETVGRALRDGWEVSKEFGKGMWATLTEERDHTQ